MAGNKRTINRTNEFKYLVFDVDGVFTSGPFLYTIDGKFAKTFGPHDNDGVKIIRKKIDIQAISADKRGFKISKKRIESDMKIPLTYVSEKERLGWFKKSFKNLKEVIYMADGMHDADIFNYVGYSIAPQNAFYLAKNKAKYVTDAKSGEGAVAEACLHVLNKFFNSRRY